MQLLAGSKIIDVDQGLKEDRALFQGAYILRKVKSTQRKRYAPTAAAVGRNGKRMRGMT